MILLLFIINSLAILWTYKVFFSYISVHQITQSAGQLHSYKPKLKLEDVLERRYIKQTFLMDKVTLREMALYYLLWSTCFSLFLLYFNLNGVIFFILLMVGLMIPVIIIENYIQAIDLSIDKGLFNLLTQINGQLVKSEDILKALQESQNKVENKYIAKILVEFNQYIKFGITPTLAFSRIRLIVNNEYLRYLFLNIEIVYSRRGNVVELMKALENEFTSIQIEINKRKVELSHERKMTAFSLMLLILTTLKIIKDNDYILTYYQSHTDFAFFLMTFVFAGIGFIIKANLTKY